jgi:putative phosphoesterase
MFPYLPDEVSPADVVARIGLIADTHMPQRWPSLPTTLFPVLDGVDLLLHSGDVGQLWVLDQLSSIAPVIAVHGNDETAEAQTHLPAQQVLTIAGQRILLWHSHYADREMELALRRVDTWRRILNRSAEQARAAGAQMVVMGHLHVPFCIRHAGIWIINPGAIASGNYQTRQVVQSVALLFLLVDGTHRVWSGEKEQVTVEDLLGSLERVHGIPAGERAAIGRLIRKAGI